MAIDSGVFEGKRLSQEQISELEDLDDGRSGLQLKDGKWVEDLSYEPEIKGKGYGQAAYLKLLDYADEVWSAGRSARATRAWEALERRQDELGIVVERIPMKGKSGFLLKRLQNNSKGPKKNPVIESGIPGVRMAYMKKPGVFGSEYNWDSEIIEASKHEKGLIGETPVTSTSKRYQYNEGKFGNDWTKSSECWKSSTNVS